MSVSVPAGMQSSTATKLSIQVLRDATAGADLGWLEGASGAAVSLLPFLKSQLSSRRGFEGGRLD